MHPTITTSPISANVPADYEVVPATFGDYISLMKPRIMMLVVFTAAAGLIAAPLDVHPVLGFAALLAVALGSGAAGALNMWYDHDIDAEMARTASRPIPSGRVSREDALMLGLSVSVLSVTLMFLAANWLAAALLAVSIVYYAVIYTMWLKRSTPQNIVIGGGAGAFPPVIGWAAVTGSTPLDAWILFAIIFMWTPPHFWALSLLANKEYAKVGVPMLPVTHGAAETRKQILIYSLVLAPLAVTPVFIGLAGWVYGAVAVGLGLGFVYLAARVFRSAAGDDAATGRDRKTAQTLFAYSIAYLFILFAALMGEHLVASPVWGPFIA